MNAITKLAGALVTHWSRYKKEEQIQRGMRNSLIYLMKINGLHTVTVRRNHKVFTISIVEESERIYIAPTPEILALLDSLGIAYKTSVREYLKIGE